MARTIGQRGPVLKWTGLWIECERLLMRGRVTRLLSVSLDAGALDGRPPAQAADLRTAVAELSTDARFAPALPHPGPFRLAISCPDGRLSLAVHDAAGQPLRAYILAFSGLRRHVREYLAMLDAYEQARAHAGPHGLETVDMARRGVHNAGAAALAKRLEGKVDVDEETARRLFTLVAVLGCRG